MTATTQRESALHALGFRFGTNGPHAARTMMLSELRALLEHVGPEATRADYTRAIVDENALAKPTRKARELTYRHLSALYGLDANPIFRALKRLWPLNVAAQPMIALAASIARDPLLRGTQALVLTQPEGVQVPRETFEHHLATCCPDRFSPASLKSFAQNVAGSWTFAGFLEGKAKKFRVRPQTHPEAAAFLLFLSYLDGRSGQRLFTSDWAALLCSAPDEVEALANAASHRGLLVFMNAGGVKEVRFPGYLTPDEERMRQELLHVV